MKVQELEAYKDQCKKGQEDVKTLKAKVHWNMVSYYWYCVVPEKNPYPPQGGWWAQT